MSDISDVLSALAVAVNNAVYPELKFDQPGQIWDSGGSYDTPASTDPVAANNYDTGKTYNSGLKYNDKKSPSVSGTPIVIYPGWPASANLATDLANGKTHVSIFPKAEERNTTRYHDIEQVVIEPAPTLALAITGPFYVVGQTFYDTPGAAWDAAGNFDQAIQRNMVVTVGGAVSVPQNLALRINSKFYTYSVQKHDTPTSIAAALCALVQADISGTSVSGAAISIGPSGRVQAARVGGFGTIAREVRRQERVIQITVWANAPALRDVISSAIDVSLADQRFLTMPDGFGARLIYKNSMVIDGLQKEALYRRDLNYCVEYATTISESRAAVIAPQGTINEFSFTA